jgi:hypothetical protein
LLVLHDSSLIRITERSTPIYNISIFFWISDVVLFVPMFLDMI